MEAVAEVVVFLATRVSALRESTESSKHYDCHGDSPIDHKKRLMALC